MSCTNCKCEEWKLASLIYSEGVSFTHAVSTGVCISSGGIGAGTSQSGGISQTNISALAAPPVNPQADVIKGLGIIGAIICGGIGYLINGFFSMIGGVCLGTTAGMILGALLPNTVYEENLARWQKVRMCLRCGTFYAPEQSTDT